MNREPEGRGWGPNSASYGKMALLVPGPLHKGLGTKVVSAGCPGKSVG